MLIQNISRDFNRAATVYDRYASFQRHMNQTLFCYSQPLWQPSSYAPVLDLGCGTGYFQELVRSDHCRFPLIQLDLSYEMCSLARTYRSIAPYGENFAINGDMHMLPFKPASFQHIHSAATLQWSQKPATVIASLHQLLQARGSLAIATFGPQTLQELRSCYEACSLPAPIYTFPTTQELATGFEQAGFHLLHTFEETVTETFSSLTHLMHHLKQLGARYKERASFMSKQRFSALESYYRHHFSDNTGFLKATWHALYFIAIASPSPK